MTIKSIVSNIGILLSYVFLSNVNAAAIPEAQDFTVEAEGEITTSNCIFSLKADDGSNFLNFGTIGQGQKSAQKLVRLTWSDCNFKTANGDSTQSQRILLSFGKNEFEIKNGVYRVWTKENGVINKDAWFNVYTGWDNTLTSVKAEASGKILDAQGCEINQYHIACKEAKKTGPNYNPNGLPMNFDDQTLGFKLELESAPAVKHDFDFDFVIPLMITISAT